MIDGKNGNHALNGKASSQNSQTSPDSQSLILAPRGDYQTLLSYQKSEVFREFTETRPAEILVNIAICLIHQANYLVDQQLKDVEMPQHSHTAQ